MCVCIPAPSIKLESLGPFPWGYASWRRLLFFYHSAFCCHYTSLFASLPQWPHPSFCPSLSRYTFDAPSLYAPSLHYCSPAVVRCFMGCLLKRRSVTGSPFSSVSSSLPPPAHGESLKCSFSFFATLLLHDLEAVAA